MPEGDIATCPQCGEPVWQNQTFTMAHSTQVDEAGKTVPGSQQTVGLFHPGCWEEYRRQHRLAG